MFFSDVNRSGIILIGGCQSGNNCHVMNKNEMSADVQVVGNYITEIITLKSGDIIDQHDKPKSTEIDINGTDTSLDEYNTRLNDKVKKNGHSV